MINSSQAAARPRVSIYIGEVVVFTRPTVIETVLGSCVAVCLRNPVARVGGMNHILLPGSDASKASRFGQHAMELLIGELIRHGAERRRLAVKAFGAGHLLPGAISPTVGDLNAAFVREFLERERIPLDGGRLGGTHAVKLAFTTDTGQSLVRGYDGSCRTLPIKTLAKRFSEGNSWVRKTRGCS